MPHADELTARCAVCRKTARYRVPTLAISLERALDVGLSPEDSRLLLQECPRCGYVSTDIRLPLETDKAILRSPEYLGSGRTDPPSGAERAFVRYSLLCRARGDHNSAGWALLHAVRAVGGVEGAGETAYRYRRLALRELRRASAQELEDRNKMTRR